MASGSSLDEGSFGYREQGAELRATDKSRSFRIVSSVSGGSRAWREKKYNRARWRHTIGIILLLVTVVLWTASNFLASTIFADNTYSKPYFVTYINTAFFIIPLAPLLLVKLRKENLQLKDWRRLLDKKLGQYTLLKDQELEHDCSSDDLPSTNVGASDTPAESQDLSESVSSIESTSQGSLTIAETARLSVEFCIPWFLANYFIAACLEYTTVASSTILSSTSSIWTLAIGSLVGVERFTFAKLLGVLASLAGVVLISSVDMSGKNDENRGSFPSKTPREIMIGDALAFLSALLYGIYAILMKKRIGDEGKVNMPLFFAFIGLFNVLALWPGLIILHFTGVETFELPPTKRVLTIIIINSVFSLISDFCWAMATLLTSPLVITVGLSLSIPLSLVGQMILESQYSGFIYWFGASIVFLSFVFVNYVESKDEEDSP